MKAFEVPDKGRTVSEEQGEVLVPMGPEHLNCTLEWLADPALRRLIDCLHAPGREENEQYWRRRWEDERRKCFAVLDTSGRHVGNCGLSDIDLDRGKAELWIYLGDRRRNGIGSRAVAKLLGYAFEHLGLRRVSVRVLAVNIDGLCFFKAMGFIEEGRWREDTVHEGKAVDSLWLSLLAGEYRRKKT